MRRRKHREYDLPAVIHMDGSLEWYQDGKLHRGNDLPARVATNGYMEWGYNGVKHRVDVAYQRPAVIYPDGTCEFWWHDEMTHAVLDPDRVIRHYPGFYKHYDPATHAGGTT